MSTDGDLIKLYSGQILALAADIPLTERLRQPDATVKRRSPLCGSTVTVDVNLQNGVVSAYGQDVKACALGQAAASVVGQSIVGQRESDIRKARDQLKDMLKADGAAPDAPFDQLKVLQPAREYKNRHSSIMLALDAVCEALEQIEERQRA